MQFHERKVFLNLIKEKDFFKWNEGWSIIVHILVVLRQKEFLMRFVDEKRTHVVDKFCAYKNLGMQFHEKRFSI